MDMDVLYKSNSIEITKNVIKVNDRVYYIQKINSTKIITKKEVNELILFLKIIASTIIVAGFIFVLFWGLTFDSQWRSVFLIFITLVGLTIIGFIIYYKSIYYSMYQLSIDLSSSEAKIIYQTIDKIQCLKIQEIITNCIIKE